MQLSVTYHHLRLIERKIATIQQLVTKYEKEHPLVVAGEHQLIHYLKMDLGDLATEYTRLIDEVPITRHEVR